MNFTLKRFVGFSSILTPAQPNFNSAGNFKVSTVSIETGYGLYDRGFEFRVLIRARFFSSPRLPDRFWGTPSLLSKEEQGLFPRGLSGRGVKLTTQLNVVPKSRVRGYIYPLLHTPSRHSAELINHRNYFTFCTFLRLPINEYTTVNV
jgi:hypothetical protein